MHHSWIKRSTYCCGSCPAPIGKPFVEAVATANVPAHAICWGYSHGNCPTHMVVVVPLNLELALYLVPPLCMVQVASLASATFVCTLGREQQYFLSDQLSASLAPPSWHRCWLAAESLLFPKTPWLEPPSWPRRWLTAESLSLLEIPSQELVVSGQYSIVSHKFFVCLSEALGVESASHQQSLRVQFLQSYSTSFLLSIPCNWYWCLYSCMLCKHAIDPTL